MKKVLVATILGLATATGVFAQGHVAFGNYVTAPYNQVVWAAGTGGGLDGKGVTQATVQLQLWYGSGIVTDASTLLPGITFGLNPNYTYVGAAGTGGYYDTQIQNLPDTGSYTFQIRASGTLQGTPIDTVASVSALWQPDGINSTSLPANIDSHSIGLVVSVPEPTTLALAGLGSVALLVFRRRRS